MFWDATVSATDVATMLATSCGSGVSAGAGAQAPIRKMSAMVMARIFLMDCFILLFSFISSLLGLF
jgi:hypothetical protein